MRGMSLLLVGLLWVGPAVAQSADDACPQLPPGAGLVWELVQGPDFVFCKALDPGDGRQALSVMIGPDPVFRPERGLRDDAATIDGHKVRWYRGDVATQRELHVRETLVPLGRRRNAHVVVRADSESMLARNRELAEALRFDQAAVGGD